MYSKGYRVTYDGKLLNPKGEEISIKLYGNQSYPIRQMYVDGKKRTFTLHRFAAYCFYGDHIFRDGIQVRHLNGNVLDISKENIALGTCSDNQRDKAPEIRRKSASIASRSRTNFEKRSLRKLSDEQAREVKKLLNEGIDGVSIAKKFMVSDETVYQIKRGETYKDVQI